MPSVKFQTYLIIETMIYELESFDYLDAAKAYVERISKHFAKNARVALRIERIETKVKYVYQKRLWEDN